MSILSGIGQIPSVFGSGAGGGPVLVFEGSNQIYAGPSTTTSTVSDGILFDIAGYGSFVPGTTYSVMVGYSFTTNVPATVTINGLDDLEFQWEYIVGISTQSISSLTPSYAISCVPGQQTVSIPNPILAQPLPSGSTAVSLDIIWFSNAGNLTFTSSVAITSLTINTIIVCTPV